MCKAQYYIDFLCRILAVPLSLLVPHIDRHESGSTRGDARGSAGDTTEFPDLR